MDVSKAFDRVWHEGLIYKIKRNGVTGPPLELIQSHRFQRVVLNGQSSTWLPVTAGVPQGSILGPLFFLIYINDLSNSLSSTAKLFADDTSLFSVVNDVNLSQFHLNSGLKKISEWAYQWKMAFNPDISKQAQEVTFSRKAVKASHPAVSFNDIPVARCLTHKHLGMYLDEKLNFGYHITKKIAKANKGIGVIKKLHNVLPRRALLTIYKCFIRPNFDYGDFIYDQPNNGSFCSKIENVQYNAALAITGAIRGTSQTKLYRELGLESLKSRRWLKHLCTLYKIKTTGLPPYLNNMLPKVTHHSQTRNSKDLSMYQTRSNIFKYSFFPIQLCNGTNLTLVFEIQLIQCSEIIYYRLYDQCLISFIASKTALV